MRKALAHLPTPKDVDSVLHAIAAAIQALGDDVDGEIPVRHAEFDINHWSEGVEHYCNTTPEELDAYLGITDGYLEGFNQTEDPDGATDPWTKEGEKVLKSPSALPLRLRWHQLIGVLHIMDRMFEGKPVLVMDNVGVGKTIQGVGVITLYAFFRAFFETRGHFPGKFCRLFDAQSVFSLY